MSKKKKEKPEEEVVEIGYHPIGNQPFGMEEMFAQGAAALDLAAVIAHERQDVDALIRVGHEWTRMAKAISTVEVVEDEKRPVIEFGFGGGIHKKEEEENGRDEGKSVSAHNSKSWQLRKRGH